MLGFESVSLLDEFGNGVAPTFTIVNSKKYIRDINSANSSSARNSTLPPSFIVSLSYKPQNNTALRLLSSHNIRTVVTQSVQPIAQNSPPINAPQSDNQFSNPLDIGSEDGSAFDLSNGLEPDFGSGSGDLPQPVNENNQDDSLASLLLSSTATFLKEDSFLDLWTNITGNKEHNLVFVIVNGTVSSCLDGVLKVGEETVGLWNTTNTFNDDDSEEEEEREEEGGGGEKATIQVKFSAALHAVKSVVSWLVTPLTHVWSYLSVYARHSCDSQLILTRLALMIT